jgi:hypothetical protein
MTRKHFWLMIAGCVLPLSIFLLGPTLGLSKNLTFVFFVIAMGACHLLMWRHHKAGHQHHSRHIRGTSNESHN